MKDAPPLYDVTYRNIDGRDTFIFTRNGDTGNRGHGESPRPRIPRSADSLPPKLRYSPTRPHEFVYNIPTVQQVALRMLRYIGVTQFTPQAAGSELESLGPGDLEDVANAITGALQEIRGDQPLGSAVKRRATRCSMRRTQVTLNLTAQKRRHRRDHRLAELDAGLHRADRRRRPGQ